MVHDVAILCFLCVRSLSKVIPKPLLPQDGCIKAIFKLNMAVNLSKNGSALSAAYKEVVDEKSATNW